MPIALFGGIVNPTNPSSLRLPQSRSRFPALLALAAVAALGTACGNSRGTSISSASYLYAPTNSYQLPAIQIPTSTDGFNCPYSPNVLPHYDTNIDGTDRYRVCTNSAAATDIRITGQTAHSTQICVIPAQYYDENHVVLKPDLTTGQPLMQCYQITGSAIYASFSGVSYNSVFIVENPDQGALVNCLTGVSTQYDCPAYSFGKFR